MIYQLDRMDGLPRVPLRWGMPGVARRTRYQDRHVPYTGHVEVAIWVRVVLTQTGLGVMRRVKLDSA